MEEGMYCGSILAMRLISYFSFIVDSSLQNFIFKCLMEVLLRGVNFFTGSIRLVRLARRMLRQVQKEVELCILDIFFCFFSGVDIMTFQKTKNNLLFLLDSVWI